MRSSHVLQGQARSLGHTGPSLRSDAASKALQHMLSVVSYYEGQLSATPASTAKHALRTVAKLIEKDGLYGASDIRGADGPPWVALLSFHKIC